MADLFAALPVRRNCPFRSRRPFCWEIRVANDVKPVERKTEQMVHVSTPFGPMALGARLPEGTRSLPEDPIDGRPGSL